MTAHALTLLRIATAGCLKNLLARSARAASSLHNRRIGFPLMIVSLPGEIGECFLIESSVRISHFCTGNCTHPFSSGS